MVRQILCVPAEAGEMLQRFFEKQSFGLLWTSKILGAEIEYTLIADSEPMYRMMEKVNWWLKDLRA